MATETIVTIKPAGGGSYTTLNAAESAERANLVTGDKILVFEVYSGGDCLNAAISFNTGWTTSATQYIEIRAAAGNQHQGTWNTNKAYGVHDATSGHIIDIQKDVHITRMQFGSDMAGSSTVQALIHTTGAGGKATINQSILKCTGNHVPLCIMLESSSVIVMNNSISLANNTTSGYTSLNVKNAGCTFSAYNCVFISYAVVALNRAGIQGYSSATITTQNCYFSAANTYTYWNYDATATFNKGANDMTSGTDAATAAYRNIAYSTANFTNVTYGSEDLHVIEGSALIGEGADLSGQFTVDIDGDTRTDPWSVGADVISAAVASSVALFFAMW